MLEEDFLQLLNKLPPKKQHGIIMLVNVWSIHPELVTPFTHYSQDRLLDVVRELIESLSNDSASTA